MIRNRSIPARRTLALAAAAMLVVTACGSDDAADSDTPAPAADTADDSATADDSGSSGDGNGAADDGNGDGDATADAVGPVVQENGSVSFEVGTQLPPHGEGDDPAVGMPAPVVEGERFDGSAITIGGPTDTPTMYVFLAHWCPHCNDEIPELLSLLDDGRLPADFDIVGISTAVAADRDNYPPSAWMTEKGWAWDAMADDDQVTAMSVFGGTSFPFTVLADGDGTVLARRAGSAPADDILSWIEDGLAGT